MLAVSGGHERIVEYLLENCTDATELNTANQTGRTPFWNAVKRKEWNIMVDTDSKDNKGKTPLMLAVEAEHTMIVKRFAAYSDTDFLARDHQDFTARDYTLNTAMKGFY
ncbi:hypothetical protein K469DRAFT_689323 [Zopfia rhizophila CBS 207.26]|uniref:Ankyrin n=1 Tax=Zopfia rhizophila CBS 207.26 TaxID=1314779 RepID=A0A6A6EU78_9PEZI|nr:hypothetical protein K469DRAFT_689323 [Zopfia rhizophila CBS 207.26]